MKSQKQVLTQEKDKFKEALIWLKDEDATIIFSRDASGKSLTLIEARGIKSCTNSFFESWTNVKNRIRELMKKSK